jgi:hypothetical protein
MIHAGDVIENPVTGERLVFRKTSRETNGEAVVIETFVKPNGFVAAAHLHPYQAKWASSSPAFQNLCAVPACTVSLWPGPATSSSRPTRKPTVPRSTWKRSS